MTEGTVPRFRTIIEDGKTYKVVDIPASGISPRHRKQLERFNEIQRQSALSHKQKSLEWLLARNESWGSSEVSAVLGRNSFKSREEILLEKSFMMPRFTGNAATRNGEKFEDVSIRIFEILRGVEIFPTTFILAGKLNPEVTKLMQIPEDWQHIGDSSDGQFIAIEGGVPVPYVIEVKTKQYGTVRGYVPNYYMDQCQNHMYVSTYNTCFYIEGVYKEIPLEKVRELCQIDDPLCTTITGVIGVYTDLPITSRPDYLYVYPKSVYIAGTKGYGTPAAIDAAVAEIEDICGKSGRPYRICGWVNNGFFVEKVERDKEWAGKNVIDLIITWKKVEVFRETLRKKILRGIKKDFGWTREDIERRLLDIYKCYRFHDESVNLPKEVISYIEKIVNKMRRKFSKDLGIRTEPIHITAKIRQEESSQHSFEGIDTKELLA